MKWRGAGKLDRVNVCWVAAAWAVLLLAAALGVR